MIEFMHRFMERLALSRAYGIAVQSDDDGGEMDRYMNLFKSTVDNRIRRAA